MYYPSINEAWLGTLNQILTTGELVEVRGTRSLEIIGHSVEFPMGQSILTIKDRVINRDFMFREAWWILSGQNRLDLLETHAPSYSKFSDDGIRLSGAYGPKIVDQIRFVVDTLKHDPYSRQAVINIWRENPRPSKDIPCTLSVQFLIRDGYIHTVVNMRSNDVWLGMPYDVFSFTMLTCQVALELGGDLQLGMMFHHAGSRHIYFKDSDKAKSSVTSNISVQFDQTNCICLKQIKSVISSTGFFHQILHDRSVQRLPQLPKLLTWLQ
jgi:thymidylate synthase